ncbi:M14 family zinc carboxypeptidase [Actinacidiphila sp. ITFR-21]|uniref:M14 family zinc carboxypeptidase n=1 Tax=Actinacidiphila sp. ITFR-21 TaxID=3075199 RepID=UPI002889F04D|nr:M14 family zinc carboxypeptidase [Streptomyces sp. ITFR-21]WNI17025.1 M14 family zinc carboxypeptidase [Streptomyces sp. ITFR-21]
MADAYPSVAGVAAAASAFARFHPRLCTLREIGQSREGRPLHVLSYGRGRRNVLVVAGPHSDERIGSATALRLAERVAADPWLHARADATWHFLLCLDPDGTVRSEEGPAVRRTPAAHFRHSYRPPADEQPEWAPSIRAADDQLPESQALIDLIDELQPFLQCSLHGNDLGGSWIQLTRDLPGLAEPLGKLSAERDVPVQTGTYDALYWTVSGPGVYVMPGPGRPAQFDSLPEDVNRSTWIRPHAYGGMTALFEVPMWASRKVADTDPHPDPARALAGLATLLRRQSDRTSVLLEQVRPLLPDGGAAPAHRPFAAKAGGPGERATLLRIVENLTAICPQVADEWERLHPSPVPLSRAHLTALDIAARRISLRTTGTLLRLLDCVAADALPAERLPGSAQSRVRQQCERQLAEWADELTVGHDLAWVPVSDQVGLQSETVLAAFRLLTEG